MTDPAKLEETLLPIAGAFLPKRDVTDTYFIAPFKARDLNLSYWQKPGTQWRPYGNENDNMNLYQLWEEKNFPPPASGAQAALDTDNDGMPDAWKTENKLNPNDPSDASADADKDGYTNLEEFLYRTNPNEAVDYTKAENNSTRCIEAQLPASPEGFERGPSIQHSMFDVQCSMFNSNPNIEHRMLK